MSTQARAHARGVALIAVLWLVAAMSLVISGVVQSVRSEMRTIGSYRQTVLANATGDAAILMALQSLHASQQEPKNSIQVVPVQFEGQSYTVRIHPLNGLIDINHAPVTLLAQLYRHAGGLNPEAAQALAQATIVARDARTSQGISHGFPHGFDAVEDLLKVPNMSYELYAKLPGLITAELKEGSGRVNPLAAPLGVLQILADGNVPRAAMLAARRNTDPNAMDTSFFNPAHIETTTSRSLRLEVQIEPTDGGAVQRAWHVYWGMDPRSGLPWRVLSTEQSVHVAAQSQG
jgi:general secretion pathway protein K